MIRIPFAPIKLKRKEIRKKWPQFRKFYLIETFEGTF